MHLVLGTVGWNKWSNGLERKGKEQQVSIPEICTVKPEDVQKANSAKSIIQGHTKM